MPDASEAGDRFGSGVRLAHLDGDGRADLVAGASGERLGAEGTTGGAAWVLGRGAPASLIRFPALFGPADFGVQGPAFATVLPH